MATGTPEAKGHEFLFESEVKERWRVSSRTLQRWRQLGCGPGWFKVGGRVLYPLSEVLDAESTGSTRDGPDTVQASAVDE